MSGSEVELFLGASHTLAQRSNLPTRTGRRREQFDSRIDKLVLGRMLAQVAIIPSAVSQITLVSYDGDEQMLAAVNGRVEGCTLRLEGEIPFKPDGGGRNFGGNVFVGGNINIVSGGSFSSFSSSGGDGDTIILNGREVDLARAIRFGLMVPETMNVKVSDLIGAVGITDFLNGELDFSPSIRAELVASRVRSLVGDISGSGKVTVDNVVEDADLEVSGSGKFVIGAVNGSVEAKIAGSGRVTINGGSSRKFRGSVSGSGKIYHNGTVSGGARLRVSGSGYIEAGRVSGEVDANVSGSGSIRANGRTYKPRW